MPPGKTHLTASHLFFSFWNQLQGQIGIGWGRAEIMPRTRALSATSKQVLSLVLIQLWIKGGQWRPQSPSSLNGLDESPQRTPLQLITTRDKEFRCEAMFLSALHGSFCAFLNAGSRELCVNTTGGEDEAFRYTRSESELHAFNYHRQTHLDCNSIISVCLFTWCLNWFVGTRFTLPLLHFYSVAIIRSTLFCLWNGNCPRVIPIMIN